MIAGMIGCGALMLTVVGILFKVNHGLIHKNCNHIEKHDEMYHRLDKKIDILISTLEIKYPTAMKKAKKDNGNT